MFCDTHCHLYLNPLYSNLKAALARARERGVVRILIPGIDLATSRTAVELSEAHEDIFAAVGVHPNESADWGPGSVAELRALARHPKVVAIGEIGMDHYRERAPHETQTAALRAQLDLAANLDKPVVIHHRAAWGSLWPELLGWLAGLDSRSRLAKQPGVLHSFDGTVATAHEVIARGFLVGISGPVTFKNALDKQEMAATLPLETLLIETDAPYLTPHPHRGQANEPAFVTYVAEKIAALRQQTVQTVANQTTQNAARLFRWDLTD